MRTSVALVLAALAGCTCEVSDRALPACADCAAGPIQRARFVDADTVVAASVDDDVVREGCEGSVDTLGRDLTHVRTLSIPYDYSNHGVEGLAVDADGSIAAVSYEWQYKSNDDEEVATRLHYLDTSGNRRWSTTISVDDLGGDWDTVVLGTEFVFVGPSSGRVRAFSRATGALAWSKAFPTVADLSFTVAPDRTLLAVDPSGSSRLVALDAVGEEQWSLAPGDIGVVRFKRIAAAPDGAMAMLASDPFAEQQSLVMLAPDRSVRWEAPLGDQFKSVLGSMLTDGRQVVIAGYYSGPLEPAPSPASDGLDGFAVTFEDGVVTAVGVAGGSGTQVTTVLALTPDAMLQKVSSFLYDGGEAQLALGGSEITGNGTAILTVARE